MKFHHFLFQHIPTNHYFVLFPHGPPLPSGPPPLVHHLLPLAPVVAVALLALRRAPAVLQRKRPARAAPSSQREAPRGGKAGSRCGVLMCVLLRVLVLCHPLKDFEKFCLLKILRSFLGKRQTLQNSLQGDPSMGLPNSCHFSKLGSSRRLLAKVSFILCDDLLSRNNTKKKWTPKFWCMSRATNKPNSVCFLFFRFIL